MANLKTISERIVDAAGTGKDDPIELSRLGPAILVADATTYTALAANSGRTHVLPDFTASCTISLPASPIAGYNYKFVASAVAADAQNWVVSANGKLFSGGVISLDTDDPADTVAAVFPNGSTHNTLTITTPSGGNVVEFIYNGTSWVVNGMIISAAVPAFSAV